MVEFLLNIGHHDGKTTSKKIADDMAHDLFGKMVGNVIDGKIIGEEGQYMITGGSDKDGFPMRKDLPLEGRKKLYIAKGIGFRTKRRGERKRKRVHGGLVTEDIYQINMKKIENAESS